MFEKNKLQEEDKVTFNPIGDIVIKGTIEGVRYRYSNCPYYYIKTDKGTKWECIEKRNNIKLIPQMKTKIYKNLQE